MTKQKIKDKQLEEKILEILRIENRGISTREMAKQLEQRFEIKRSPPIILRHLNNLKKNKLVFEEDGKKV